MNTPVETSINNSAPAHSGPSPQHLTARMESFESFWEGPEDVEKGYHSFQEFYKANYLPLLPKNLSAKTLIVSCGPGYFVHTLVNAGYTDVTGMDCDPEKVRYGQAKNLNCRAEHAVAYLAETNDSYDMIICEQELNHLTKDEMVMFLDLCYQRLHEGGTLVVHGLNGANPITGAEALAQNFDHFNTFTEYSLRQVLGYCGFGSIQVIPLNLYVFRDNPANYVAMAVAGAFTFFFQIMFKLYGKFNRLFTKKIAAIATRSGTPRQSLH